MGVWEFGVEEKEVVFEVVDSVTEIHPIDWLFVLRI